MMTRGLYIHIPFCKKKCNYCDFVSLSSCDKKIINSYLNSLIKEIKLNGRIYNQKRFTSIYFGGGTPSLLDAEQLNNLLLTIYNHFDICDNSEITIEVNPKTLDYKKAYLLKKAGFNRVSLGIQSTYDNLLKDMGRVHNSKDAFDCINDLKKANFKNINVDLIYGLPKQTNEIWKNTLKKIMEFEIFHLAAYGLKIEDNTYWGKKYKNGELILPAEEEVCEMYMFTESYSKKFNFEHYEISNWSKPGFESIHNKTYWLNNEYIGLGLNASSHLEDIRYKNTPSINKYIKMLENNKIPIIEYKYLNMEDKMTETMIMGLRLKTGVNKYLFKNRFGCLPEDVYGNKINKLLKKGLIKVDSKSIALKEDKFLLANIAMIEFV